MGTVVMPLGDVPFTVTWIESLADAHWRHLIRVKKTVPYKVRTYHRQLVVIGDATKDGGGMTDIKITRRGRPPKPKPGLFMAISDGSLDTMVSLSNTIAKALHIKSRNALTDALAEAAMHYPNMLDIKTRAPLLVKRRGNRPKIHLATLLYDCARALQQHKGMDAGVELRRIGERTEHASEVIKCAKAVLAAMDINHPQSMRQQAKQAAILLQATQGLME